MVGGERGDALHEAAGEALGGEANRSGAARLAPAPVEVLDVGEDFLNVAFEAVRNCPTWSLLRCPLRLV